MLFVLSGHVAVCVIGPFGVKPEPLFVNDVTPMIPVDGVTAITGAVPTTVTEIGKDVDPLKLVSPLYLAVIEFEPTGREVVVYEELPSLFRSTEFSAFAPE